MHTDFYPYINYHGDISVCDIHFLLQKFIKNAYSYAMDLEVDGNICIDSLLAKSVETLLQRNLREAMDRSISERIRSLDNAIQFIINLDHLDKSIKDVEGYIKVRNLNITHNIITVT